MTIAVVLLALLAMLVFVGAIATVAHRHRTPPADRFTRQALTRVVERHEREQVGRE